MIKNAEEAREIIECREKNAAVIPELIDQMFFAKGYLACLDGPEVQGLVEALENRVHCLACQTHEHPTTKEALTAFKASRGGKI